MRPISSMRHCEERSDAAIRFLMVNTQEIRIATTSLRTGFAMTRLKEYLTFSYQKGRLAPPDMDEETFRLFQREIFRRKKARERQRTVCTSSEQQRTSGGKDPLKLFCEQVVDVFQRLADELLAAHMADLAGSDEGAVVAAQFCLFGGQVAFGAVG